MIDQSVAVEDTVYERPNVGQSIGQRTPANAYQLGRACKMIGHLLVVLSNPVEGLEDDYRDWYTKVHLQDVVKQTGFESAQLFRFAEPYDDGQPPRYRFMALYEVTEDGLEEAKASMATAGLERADALAAGREPIMPLSPALADDRVTAWYIAEVEKVVHQDH